MLQLMLKFELLAKLEDLQKSVKLHKGTTFKNITNFFFRVAS